MNYEHLLNCNARAELARRNLLDFVEYVKPTYEANWHHKLLCEYLDKFSKGEIKRLMVFMPPQHGKAVPSNTLVFTPIGWVEHGNLMPGDFVFGQDGKQKKVIANSGIYKWNVDQINLQGGKSILAAKEHEWVLSCDHDDHKGRVKKVYETQQIFRKRHRRNPAIDISPELQMPEKKLKIDPYVLGCWLGDGHSRQGVLTVGKEDIQHFSKIGEAREIKPGIYRVLIKGLTTKLNESGLLKNKHIPIEYMTSSIEQRWELLRGLMDTDGCVDFRGRCEFSQKDNGLAEDVYLLLRTLGIKGSINHYESKLNGVKVGFKKRICFSPGKQLKIFNLERKQSKLNQKAGISRGDRNRFFIESIIPHGEKMVNCIQVDGGVYLVGEDLIPTHNSELVSRNLPAYLLGKNPKAKIVLASYSSYLSSSFNRDCQRIIDGKEYKEVFPETKLNKSNVVSVSGSWLRNSEIFETVGEGGFLKAVGVGGSLTGTPADFAIIDDPVKDSLEAMSSTSQFRNWNWYTDVLYSRIHNNTSILITQTRWDVNDLSGKLLKQMESGGEKWVVLSLPAVKVDESSKDDQRSIGEALWPSKHSLEKLNIVRQQSIRTYEALYQQNPQPIQAGGEFWKQFNVTRHVRSIPVAPSTIHVSLDNNVNPYVTCSVWQVLGTQINQVHEIAAVDPYNNAVKAAHLLINWLRKINYKDVVFVYGDPSASAKSTVDENNASFFIKYIDELRKSGFKVTSRVGKSAPEVALSAAFINEIYEQGFNGYSISISDTCTLSIEDYYSVKEDKDGKMKKVKVKDVSTGVTFERYGHFSDAKRYFITELLKEEFSKYKNSTRQSLAGKSAYFR